MHITTKWLFVQHHSFWAIRSRWVKVKIFRKQNTNQKLVGRPYSKCSFSLYRFTCWLRHFVLSVLICSTQQKQKKAEGEKPCSCLVRLWSFWRSFSKKNLWATAGKNERKNVRHHPEQRGCLRGQVGGCGQRHTSSQKSFFFFLLANRSVQWCHWLPTTCGDKNPNQPVRSFWILSLGHVLSFCLRRL